MRGIAVLLGLALAGVGAFDAENVYPDPGFEESGTGKVAHSGQRSGHLSVGAKTHWQALGGTFPVEPFATYRATGWAKATVAEGTAHALYVYQWDSYVWAFSRSAAIPSGGDWQEFSITFCVPQDLVYFHPLAVFDASGTEAWIDDVVIEQVMTPEETAAALEAKDSVQGDDARLLGRWYVAHEASDKALGLMEEATDPRVKADLACVIGSATEDPELRVKMLMAMLASGAPGMHGGMERLKEVAEGLDGVNPLSVIAEALPEYASDGVVLENLATFVTSWNEVRIGGLPAPVGARQEHLARFKAAVAAVEAKLGADAATNGALAKMKEAAVAWEEALQAEAAALGACAITLGGKPLGPESHVIVLAAEPTPQEETAARDLQMHLERMSGLLIPVVSDTECAGKACLSVGKNRFTESLGLGIDYAALGVEGIRIIAEGPHIVLTGNKRGVLYAVYVFLEEHLGCRWFTPDCQTWPRSGNINVGALDVTYVPSFEYRDTDYPNCRPPEFGVRNRLNGMYALAPEEWGNNVDYKGFVHTFNYLVPPERYFAEHPEYFSEVGGQRLGEHTQLCLTNPEVLRIATETVKQWIKEAPDASIISVSQNDWHNYCTCPKCTALAEKEGSQSGPLLHFVNGIADAIAEEHPDIIIDTLAYQYTRKPPKFVKPRPNVAVRLCSIECEFNRPLATSPYNETFVKDIEGWNAICDRLHIWDYVINYSHCVQPFPNFNVLKPNIQFFRDHGVTGIYEEANYFSKGGEFAELRTYLLAKLLWDPEYDVNRAIDEFCKAYYGECWLLIRAYIDDIHQRAVLDPDFHMTIWAPPNCPFGTADALATYRSLFDQAEAMMQADPVRLHRVQVARLPIMYTQLAQASSPAYVLDEDGLKPTSEAANLTALADRFEAIARKEGLTRVAENRERGDLGRWLETVRRPVEPLPVVRLEGGGLEAVIVPGLGGRILSLTYKGAEVMNMVKVEGGIDPRSGGYKEFSEMGYRSPGWVEPYSVADQGERFVVLEASLSNGLKLSRRYEVDPAAAVIRVATTLTNISGAAKPCAMRVHPCFHMGDAVGSELRLAGKEALPLDEGAGKEQELTFRGDGLPGGEWAFYDKATGRTIVSRFKPEQVAVCYFNWNGPQHRANLELWSTGKELAPNESLKLEHEYAVAGG